MIKIFAIILNFRVVAIPRLLLRCVVAICANTRKLRIIADILMLKVVTTFDIIWSKVPMFFKVFIIEKTNEKFLLEAAYFFTKNYNTTSYNYRINRLLQIIPQIFFKSPTQKKYIMAAPVESAENHRFIPLRGRLLSG